MNFRSLRRTLMLSLVCLLCVGILAPSVQAEGTAIPSGFTYQGELVLSGTPVNNSCDFEFSLYDALTGGAMVGSALTHNDVAVTSGLFTVELDFGANAFDGTPRWLEIRVRCGDETDFNLLSPRQKLTAVPQALYASQVPWSGVTGVPADLVDGDDNTTYTAGYGLTLTDSSFAVNTSTIQSRVTGVCAVGEGVQQINADGTIICDDFTGPEGPAGPEGPIGPVGPAGVDGADGLTPSNIVWVAKSGGDYTTITEALTNIDASDINPYLIKVAPGVYEDFVLLKDYVGIEGSGENITVVRSIVSDGVIKAEVRYLSVIPIVGDGIVIDSSSPIFSHVTVIQGSLVSPAVSVRNGAAPIIRDSSLTGISLMTLSVDATSTVRIANTMLNGAVLVLGSAACVGAYNLGFVELGPNCLPVP